jgi:succinate semialdehyde reductase
VQKKRNWLNHLEIKNYLLFDDVKPNPSIEITEKIIKKFSKSNINFVIGLGGGSSLDVAKYVAYKLKKKKIMIPTTFGSGSEVTRISVLKVNGKKKSFHDDEIFTDIAIVDSFFIKNSPIEIIRNSAIDACAQCTEAYDSKNANPYTKFFCKTAFDVLEDGILNKNYSKLPYGSLLTGLGFGNSSTTLGHGLSYVYSNEGVSHGHALAFTTTVAHKFNNSIFYERFLKIVKKLNFPKISLRQNLKNASELILLDRKHLDNNPKTISKKEIMILLQTINEQKI